MLNGPCSPNQQAQKPTVKPLRFLLIPHAYAHLWVPARGGNYRSAGRGVVRTGDAPLVSPDGKLIFFATDDLHFAEGQFFTLQDMAGLPPLPDGKTAIGQGYNLVGTGFPSGTTVLTGSVSIQYLGADVLTAQADEDQLTLHFWNGLAWRALATYRDPVYNLASARSQGPGIYALLAGVTQPIVTSVASRVVSQVWCQL